MTVEYYYLDHHDNDDGSKTYDVCDGGQTIARVDETMFDDPNKARQWAVRIRDALNRDRSKVQ
jgi:hypothetical protein